MGIGELLPHIVLLHTKGVSAGKLADNADFVISFYSWMVSLIKYFSSVKQLFLACTIFSFHMN
jgi:hypothetical protein